MSSHSFIVLTAQAATVLYAASLGVQLATGPREARRGLGAGWRLGRGLWTLGLAVYLVHMATAFHFAHGWSHRQALEETARRTEALFGLASGGGLWLNYLFTLVWLADAAWWWAAPTSYRQRPRWVALAVHGFMAFMFFNATVVFAPGPSRWLGLLAVIGLSMVAIVRRAHSPRPHAPGKR